MSLPEQTAEQLAQRIKDLAAEYGRREYVRSAYPMAPTSARVAEARDAMHAAIDQLREFAVRGEARAEATDAEPVAAMLPEMAQPSSDVPMPTLHSPQAAASPVDCQVVSLVERLRQRQMVNWVDRPDPLCQEAAAELVRMAGQHEAFGRWIVDALKVLDTIDPDDMEESEQLLALIKAGEMLTLAALAPKMLHKLKNATGPACNLKTPWLAPDEA